MVKVGTVKLSNGVDLPLLGYGTWLSTDEQQLKVALRAALDAGYRYIDTAALYKNEQFIGDVLQEYYDAGKFKRSDIFITTKLPFYGHSKADEFISDSLKKLRTDYIDLYLIHTPVPMKVLEDGKFQPELIPLIDTWRQLEKYYKAGTLKAIGVSNFNAEQLQDLYDKAEIKPHNLQVELDILFPQTELVNLCKKLKIVVTSYGTLGSPGSVKERGGVEGDCLGHPLVVELAKKYGKTPAQILLRQTIQRGVNVIPKSLNAGRVAQNINVFDFEISADDMKRFETEITKFTRLFPFLFAIEHPWFPFHDVKAAQKQKCK